MEIPCLSRNLRNFSNPYLHSFYSFASQSPFPSNILYHFCRFYTTTPSHSAQSLISAIGSSLICNKTSQSLPSLDFNLGLFRRSCRSFSSSSLNPPSPEKSQSGTSYLNVSKRNAASKQFWDIIYIIRGNQKDLESKLDSMNVRLTTYLVAKIFRVLNNHKVSAFRFFKWVSVNPSKFPCNSDVYSLVIDNFGRLDDYEGMFAVLAEFRRRGIVLNHKAFGFLLVQLSNEEESIKICVERVVELLIKVGGSCRASGVMALIEMFCSLGFLTMAKFVIEITERKSSFYNIIIREQCRRKDFEGAICTLNELRAVVGGGLDVGIFNYLLSCMCKNERFDEARSMFEQEMLEERYCPPNSLTFEVMICHLCEIGDIESAVCYFDMMVSRGLEPRLSTHAAFVKTYFNLQRYEDAYSYTVDSSLKHGWAKNATYSLLATLHEKSGNLVEANKILSELMDAGLKPNFPVYNRVMKKLQVEGRYDLANDLKGKFSKCSL